VIGHTSSFPVGGQPGEERRGGLEEKTMPLREVGGAQTYAQAGQAKNHINAHDPQMNRTSLQSGSILIDRSYKLISAQK